MKLKKLNVTICGYELYVEIDAPVEKIREILKKKDKSIDDRLMNNLFCTLKPKK